MSCDLTVKILLVLGMGSCPSLWAADNLLFRGTLIEPLPCEINNGGKVDVDFKEVGVNKVNGVNYEKTMDYKITCGPNATGRDMTLTLIGLQTDYDSAAVKTTVQNLGIRVLQNGTPLTLNKAININPADPPKLTAVPVKKPGTVLEKGDFSATATLQAKYQ
ncbi:fimbrial protein [Serratia rubidaea]|uniref:Fimbrial protein n=1 Tax=Serratia rubidaea TaxID=61652 RepID=A0ABS0MIM5_SERRU|nr:fimbrial protein [Serratia rubidaea]MBH1931207.1 fimbrial protein [Serratia rubidaea]MDC6117169.1 fimbrial protein [Serratia rubidaea]